MTKTCNKCRIEKSRNEFYTCKSNKDGLQYRCKECSKKIVKEYSQTIRGKEVHRKSVSKYQKTANGKAHKSKYHRHYVQTPEGRAIKKKNYYKYSHSPKGKFLDYQQSARKRSITFSLTFEQFSKFWDKDCYYCKSKIDGIGLDRVDSDIGYEIDNVVSCCCICNWMKLDMNAKDFISHVEKIHAVVRD